MPPWVTAENFTLIGFCIAILAFIIYLIDTHHDEKGAAAVFIVGSIFSIIFSNLLS
tara:strand:+ start:317 stop:484 length:168 start_codon:yes stop_codon:yes gene_type:complete